MYRVTAEHDGSAGSFLLGEVDLFKQDLFTVLKNDRHVVNELDKVSVPITDNVVRTLTVFLGQVLHNDLTARAVDVVQAAGTANVHTVVVEPFVSRRIGCPGFGILLTYVAIVSSLTVLRTGRLGFRSPIRMMAILDTGIVYFLAIGVNVAAYTAVGKVVRVIIALPVAVLVELIGVDHVLIVVVIILVRRAVDVCALISAMRSVTLGGGRNRLSAGAFVITVDASCLGRVGLGGFNSLFNAVVTVNGLYAIKALIRVPYPILQIVDILIRALIALGIAVVEQIDALELVFDLVSVFVVVAETLVIASAIGANVTVAAYGFRVDLLSDECVVGLGYVYRKGDLIFERIGLLVVAKLPGLISLCLAITDQLVVDCITDLESACLGIGHRAGDDISVTIEVVIAVRMLLRRIIHCVLDPEIAATLVAVAERMLQIDLRVSAASTAENLGIATAYASKLGEVDRLLYEHLMIGVAVCRTVSAIEAKMGNDNTILAGFRTLVQSTRDLISVRRLVRIPLDRSDKLVAYAVGVRVIGNHLAVLRVALAVPGTGITEAARSAGMGLNVNGLVSVGIGVARVAHVAAIVIALNTLILTACASIHGNGAAAAAIVLKVIFFLEIRATVSLAVLALAFLVTVAAMLALIAYVVAVLTAITQHVEVIVEFVVGVVILIGYAEQLLAVLEVNVGRGGNHRAVFVLFGLFFLPKLSKMALSTLVNGIAILIHLNVFPIAMVIYAGAHLLLADRAIRFLDKATAEAVFAQFRSGGFLTVSASIGIVRLAAILTATYNAITVVAAFTVVEDIFKIVIVLISPVGRLGAVNLFAVNVINCTIRYEISAMFVLFTNRLAGMSFTAAGIAVFNASSVLAITLAVPIAFGIFIGIGDRSADHTFVLLNIAAAEAERAKINTRALGAMTRGGPFALVVAGLAGLVYRIAVLAATSVRFVTDIEIVVLVGSLNVRAEDLLAVLEINVFSRFLYPAIIVLFVAEGLDVLDAAAIGALIYVIALGIGLHLFPFAAVFIDRNVDNFLTDLTYVPVSRDAAEATDILIFRLCTVTFRFIRIGITAILTNRGYGITVITGFAMLFVGVFVIVVFVRVGIRFVVNSLSVDSVVILIGSRIYASLILGRARMIVFTAALLAMEYDRSTGQSTDRATGQNDRRITGYDDDRAVGGNAGRALGSNAGRASNPLTAVLDVLSVNGFQITAEQTAVFVNDSAAEAKIGKIDLR